MLESSQCEGGETGCGRKSQTAKPSAAVCSRKRDIIGQVWLHSGGVLLLQPARIAWAMWESGEKGD